MLSRIGPVFPVLAALAVLAAAGTPPAAAQPSEAPPDAAQPEAPPAAARQQEAAPAQASPPSVELPWAGRSGGFELRWTAEELTARPLGHDAAPVLSVRTLAERDYRETYGADPEARCLYERAFAPLSLVGSILSISDRLYASCEGAAHPNVVERFTAVDLARPGTPPSLTDLFPEAEVLEALRSDGAVKKALAAREAPAGEPRSLPELLAALEEVGCEFGFAPGLLERFAFHHLEGGQVAVRLGTANDGPPCRKELVQLGLLLPVPDALREPLQRAAAGTEGFLVAGRGKLVPDAATVVKLGSWDPGR